ncbi:MAG: PAS domain-containing protein [Acidimicrobiales bacterium]|nr:PAS domain-containing protein [Acidimicrobiales bacterium]
MAEVFRQLGDTANDGVMILEPRVDDAGSIDELLIRYLNPSGARTIGFGDESQWRDRGLVEVIPENRASGLLDWYIDVFHAGDDRVQTVEFTSESPQFGGTYALRANRVGDHLAVRFRDITEQLALEAAEQRARRRLEATLESISDAFFVLDHDWRFAYVNDEACRVLGHEREELLDRVVWEAFPAAIGSEFETNYRRVADEQVPVTFDTYYPEPLDTWYAVRAYPSDEGVTVFFQDIGPQRKLQERLSQAQRVESVATLAGGIAHDFNNLLTVIAGHCALLADDLGDDHPNRVDVEAIRDAGERAGELTRQLLTFSRRQIIRPRVVDLNELIGSLEPLIRRVLPDEVELAMSWRPEPVLVEADRAEFHQALTGVVANAVEAMPGGGHLVVEIAAAELAESYTDQVPDLGPGWFGVVSVSDDGIGMDPEVLARSVEPFFTTKPPGVGTGLGLASVHGMVMQVGGHVSLYSEPGVGTTVRIYLPLSEHVVPDPALIDDGDHAEGIGGDEAVLVVDDNDSVRAFTARVLREHGYRVQTAADMDEALEVLRAGDEPVRLLVTDVVMPGGSGHDLAVAADEMMPGLAVLYVSGYTENSVIRHGVPTAEVEFLAKPFAPAELARRVRRILDRVSDS